MTRLSTLLVHPDPMLRHRLRAMLEPVDFLRVLGEAAGAEEALTLLAALPYGAVFLGVSLAEGPDGMEVARKLMGNRDHPALIFIADDESRAFEAFELDATDYLIFPCAPDRFDRTLMRLRQFRTHFRLAPAPGSRWREQPQAAPDALPPLTIDDLPPPGTEEGPPVKTVQLPLAEDEQDTLISALGEAVDYSQRVRPVELDKLAVSVDGKTLLIPYGEIAFVEAYEDYSYVHTADDKYLTSYRLKNLEGRLRPHRFFRVHRKYLVNLDMVTELAAVSGGNCLLRTAGRTRIELPISRRRLGELKQILGL